MPLDGIFLHFLRREIEAAAGCKVDKIHQPSRDMLTLALRSREGNRRLVLSASEQPGAYFVETAGTNPPQPPMFCMLLRKRLTGGVLTAVRQPDFERVLFFDFDACNEIGDREKLTLCLEMLPGKGNIILLDERGVIIDAVKRIGFTQPDIRQILPACPYVPPHPQNKLDILHEPPETVCSAVLSKTGVKLSDAFLRVVAGFSPLAAREASFHICGEEDPDAAALPEPQRKKALRYIETLRQALTLGCVAPFLIVDGKGENAGFSYFEVKQYGKGYTCLPRESFSALLCEYYGEKTAAGLDRCLRLQLERAVQTAAARESKKLAARINEAQTAEDRESLRIRAELLTTFIGECTPGASSVTVANYYEENKPETIALNPALSLRANAKNYYKQYAKAKTASNVLAALIEQGRKELAYLDSVSQALTTAAGPEDLKEIEAELRREGLLKQSKKTPEKQKTSAVFTEYSTGDGFRILAGRNNTQNDLLTFRTANKHDLWLHARNVPGSHVIVVSTGREIPDDVIGYAAGIAAFLSAAGASGAVDVDYTAVRHVKKPPGAKPGAVLYTDYRTIRVKPVNAGPST